MPTCFSIVAIGCPILLVAFHSPAVCTHTGDNIFPVRNGLVFLCVCSTLCIHPLLVSLLWAFVVSLFKSPRHAFCQFSRVNIQHTWFVVSFQNVCGNFILPETGKPCLLFYALFNLRILLYLIRIICDCSGAFLLNSQQKKARKSWANEEKRSPILKTLFKIEDLFNSRHGVRFHLCAE